MTGPSAGGGFSGRRLMSSPGFAEDQEWEEEWEMGSGGPLAQALERFQGLDVK